MFDQISIKKNVRFYKTNPKFDFAVCQVYLIILEIQSGVTSGNERNRSKITCSELEVARNRSTLTSCCVSDRNDGLLSSFKLIIFRNDELKPQMNSQQKELGVLNGSSETKQFKNV